VADQDVDPAPTGRAVPTGAGVGPTGRSAAVYEHRAAPDSPAATRNGRGRRQGVDAVTEPDEFETAVERLYEKIAARKILAVYTPVKPRIRRRWSTSGRVRTRRRRSGQRDPVGLRDRGPGGPGRAVPGGRRRRRTQPAGGRRHAGWQPDTLRRHPVAECVIGNTRGSICPYRSACSTGGLGS
jgi:hypothetical protein